MIVTETPLFYKPYTAFVVFVDSKASREYTETMNKKSVIAITILLLLVLTVIGILLLQALVSNDADMEIGSAAPPDTDADAGSSGLAAGDASDDTSTDNSGYSETDTSSAEMTAAAGSVIDPAATVDADTEDDTSSSDDSNVETNASEEPDEVVPSDLLFADLPPHPERETLREGFFKEPLSEEIQETINGVSYHENDTITFDELRYLQVLYVDFEGNTQTGELICNKKIADDLLDIFSQLYEAGYEIERVRLIDKYGGDDDASCADDNTSCFNYRVVAGTTHLSNHAKGLAIDINPFYNPYVTYPDGKEHISPPGSEPYADRSNMQPHMIDEKDLCYRLFKEHGFKWGGHWKSLKDYQHFEKP